MSDAAKQELRELVKAAVAAGMAEHACRFTAEQRDALKAVARLTPDQLTALSLFSRAVNSVAARVGTLMVWGALGAILAVLAWGIRRGLLTVD